MVSFHQAGPPPPPFEQQQQQPQSAQTYFAQPPRASAPNFLPLAPLDAGRQQARLTASQWPASGQQQQQQQYPGQPAPPPFPPPAQPSFGGGSSAQQWQSAQAQQWSHSSGLQETAQNHMEGSSIQQQWQHNGGSAGQAHAAWEQTPGQPEHALAGAEAVSYYPDPPEPLEAPGSEQQAYSGGVEGAGQAQQPGWQGPDQNEYPSHSQVASAAALGHSGAVAAATDFTAPSGYGAQPQAGAAPGLDDVSETDFWGLQGEGDQDDPFASGAPSSAAIPAQNAAHASMPQQPFSTAEMGPDLGVPQAASEATSMPLTASTAPQEPAEEAGNVGLSAEQGQHEATRDESRPVPGPEQDQEQEAPPWIDQEGQGVHTQVSLAVPPSNSLPYASMSGQHPEAGVTDQGVQLESYQQADWNASEWRQQQADATVYGQQQQQYQPADDAQWQSQQQQPSATGFEEYHGSSYSQQQQPGFDESSAPAEQYEHASYGFSAEQQHQQQQPGYNESAAPVMPAVNTRPLFLTMWSAFK